MITMYLYILKTKFLCQKQSSFENLNVNLIASIISIIIILITFYYLWY